MDGATETSLVKRWDGTTKKRPRGIHYAPLIGATTLRKRRPRVSCCLPGYFALVMRADNVGPSPMRMPPSTLLRLEIFTGTACRSECRRSLTIGIRLSSERARSRYHLFDDDVLTYVRA